MRFTDLGERTTIAGAAAAGVLCLLALGPSVGRATPATSSKAGFVQVLGGSLTINHGQPHLEGELPIHVHDVLSLSPSGKVRFNVTDGNKQVTCNLWSKPSIGNVQIEPQQGVGVAFNGGTSMCNTPTAARATWKTWVKKGIATLKFSDPLFTVVVKKAASVVRVRRGVVVVSGQSGTQTAVAVGNNQQVAVAPSGVPSQPVPAASGSPTEQTVRKQIESSLPPVKDKQAPTTTWIQTPPDPSSLRTATFAFTASESGVTFSCALDASDFHVCTSPQMLPPLPPGDHTFAVKATDTAGNVEKQPQIYTWTVDDSRILFESTRDGNPEIYVMDPVADPGGKNATNLTNNPAIDADPAWSPDRKQIAFQSNRRGKEGIWVMNADGSSPTELTRDKAANDTNPTWSPDGKQIAYESDVSGEREIYVMNSDGSGEPFGLTYNPEAAPDANFDPAWSPKGDKIAFASHRDGNYEIYVMNADGSGQTRLTNDSAVEFNPAWSPDGTLIAFHSDINGASKQIWVMNPDGTDPRQVVPTAGDDANPVWAPDGAELAFQSGPPGGTDIWIVGADGRGLTQLTFATGDDMVPDWR